MEVGMQRFLRVGSPSARLRVKIYLLLIGIAIFLMSLLFGVYHPLLAIKFRYDQLDHNLYLYQAWAFMQGRLNLAETHIDVAYFGGQYYAPFPPFPAVLLMPVAAIFHPDASPITTGIAVTLVGGGLTLLSAMTLKQILIRFELSPDIIWWLSTAFFLGTAYWFCLAWSSGVWFFAHIVYVSCILLAIREALGRGSGLLVGLFAGLAFLSRQFAIYAVPFLVIALWENANLETRRKKYTNLLELASILGICGAAYLAFNWARFGNPLETGYGLLALSGYMNERVQRYGLFNLAYVPFNFSYLFLQGFHIEFLSPDYVWPIQLDPYGTSLVFASPFLFAAFRAQWKKSLLWGAWFSIGLMIGSLLLYYNNGAFQQNGNRFALDFLPILILLVAAGSKHVNDKIWKATIIYSIALNILALCLVPFAQALALWLNVYGV
jgi:hypothetical protein